MDEKKKQALGIALSQIEKQFGKGSIMRMSDDGVIADVEAVSTGSIGLDIGLGIGGLPRGRVVEIYGPEASGKTTLALHVAAEIHKTGGGATLFFTTLTRVSLPTISSAFLMAPMRRISRRTEE